MIIRNGNEFLLMIFASFQSHFTCFGACVNRLVMIFKQIREESDRSLIIGLSLLSYNLQIEAIEFAA